ncbi:MAG: EAL domain-containing protein [Helicobacteraceae bacterium]|jgi:diguanylate cyclase (GGDEF)-like protein/PAS domain S-box-containing protein|nr:EAL domain-containing protein [Helicobacteraceae bacterium]
MGKIRDKLLGVLGIESSKKRMERVAALFFEGCPLPACITKTSDGSFIAVNDAFTKLAESGEDELLKIGTIEIGLWRDNQARLEFVDNIYKSGQSAKFVINLKKQDESRYYEIHSAPIVIDMEQAVISCLVDITEEKTRADRREWIVKRFAEFRGAASDCYFCCDANGRFTRVNAALCMLLGYSKSELLALSIGNTLSLAHYKRDIETFCNQNADLGYAEPIEQEWIKKDKTAAQMEVSLFASKDENEKPNGFWGVAREIRPRVSGDDQRKYDSYYDRLTELPNRAWLKERLRRMIKRSRIAKEKIAIVIIDISRFRLVNDAYGYRFGDATLKEVANIMDSALRSTDLLARYDGGKFAIAVGSQPIRRSVLSVIRRFMGIFDKPILIEDKKLKLSIRIGVGVFPDDGEDAQLLIKSVEDSMKKIASKEESAFCFVSDELNAKIHDRLELEKALLNALSTNEIVARYQPINEFLSGGDSRLIGVEAFARWRRSGGELPPNRFMDVAKELGAATDIDRKIYEIALNDLAMWIKNDLRVKLTVNLSKSALEDASFAKWAISLAKSKQIEPKLICFDARYGSLLEDAHTIYKTVSDLCAAGFSVCADDFGEETLFLSKLKKVGINAVKIAPKRLRLIKENEGFNSLQSIEIAMRSMGLELGVAGVENEWLDRKVGEAGAMIRQGFFYAEAMSAEEILKYAQEKHSAREIK